MTAPCVIFYGLILKIRRGGALVLEAQGKFIFIIRYIWLVKKPMGCFLSDNLILPFADIFLALM